MADYVFARRIVWLTHAGFDSLGTNATTPSPELYLNVLEPCPSIPQEWPQAVENPECSGLWRKFYGEKPSFLKRIKDRLEPIYAQLLHTRFGSFFFRLVKVSKAVLSGLGYKGL